MLLLLTLGTAAAHAFEVLLLLLDVHCHDCKFGGLQRGEAVVENARNVDVRALDAAVHVAGNHLAVLQRVEVLVDELYLDYHATVHVFYRLYQIVLR